MKSKLFLLFIYFTQITILNSQNSQGYWDKERSTTKEVTLSAGMRYWLRSDELPVGTTEIVYRITLLEEDQKIINGLADALSIFPDPTGISKGSAMTLNLISKISGDDKCYYSIFNNQNDANTFFSSGIYKTACYSNPEKINKEVNRLTIENSNCISEGIRYLWFGFKNTNAIHSEKIVLEIMPWVNNKASKGWTNTIKQQIIENCKNNIEIGKLANPDEYCLCLIDKLENKFTYHEYIKLLEMERNKVTGEIGIDCLQDTGEIDNLFYKEREEAIQLINNKQYSKAINKYLEIIAQTTPELTDYNNLGYCYLMTKQYSKAIKQLKEGEKIDESELLIKGNLAHALLLNGDLDQAKLIYIKYKSQNVDETISWGEMVQQDFEDLKRAGIISDKFDEVLNLFKQ